MIRFYKISLFFPFLALLSSGVAFAQDKLLLHEDFSKPNSNYISIGRGECTVQNGILRTKGASLCLGDKTWTDYEMKFRARVPKGEPFMQIWAGFRAANREDRYVISLRGEQFSDMIINRMGYMASEEFLGLRYLDFRPVPGKWYDIKIQVCGDRIRVYVNDEKKPRYDIVDKNSSLVPAGGIVLGGSFLANEFDYVTVTQLPADFFKGQKVAEYDSRPTPAQKEAKRVEQRADYRHIRVDKILPQRTVVSLNGDWLFLPDGSQDESKASPDVPDNAWHVMPVPNFWNPIRVWLHGDGYGNATKGTSDIYYKRELERCQQYTFDTDRTNDAWYRQWVEFPHEIAGKHVEITFEGISKAGEVYFNGHHITSHIGMFEDVTVDVSDYVLPGKNLIAVKVHRQFVKGIENPDQVLDVAVTVPVTNSMLKDLPHAGYGGAPGGLWQPVTMTITEPIRITDVFVKPALDGATFDVTIKNSSTKKGKFNLSTLIKDKADGTIIYNKADLKNITLEAGEQKVVTYAVNDLKPKLWAPHTPNLYDFNFTLSDGSHAVDCSTVTSGFRTIEDRDGIFHLNGKPYWLRGANQSPGVLVPHDPEFADIFCQLMRAGNLNVTRSHMAPYNRTWMDASDRNGVGVSQEGTWPWLMLLSSMPEKEILDIWKHEFLSLVKKYRNHPSLFFWTINNEMKFYENDPDPERAKRKMIIISDVVKQMRAIDPTRPVCFDSNYFRKEGKKRFGDEFYQSAGIDDGDIDDVHQYYNWYVQNVFEQFDGQFQKTYKTPGRMLISQEMSTGYPNNDTGAPSRFYSLHFYDAQSFTGIHSYDYSDPKYFLSFNNFATKELAEALRRTNEQCSGIMHFAMICWFKDVYDKNTIQPHLTYYGLQKALSPILVSAELWGRHLWAGRELTNRICIVNDSEQYADLAPSRLRWEIVASDGSVLSSGEEKVPQVPYHERVWLEPRINLPASLPSPRCDIKLKLTLTENGKQVSYNEYDLLLADRSWMKPIKSGKKIVTLDLGGTASALTAAGVKYEQVSDMEQLLQTTADLYIVSGLEPGKNCTDKQLAALKDCLAKNGRLLLLGSEKAAMAMYPEHITGWMNAFDLPSGKQCQGEIVNTEIEESPILDGIEPLDLRYFNNDKRELPIACHGAFKINRSDKMEAIASYVKIHGFLFFKQIRDRQNYVRENIKAFPVIKITDKGKIIASSMAHERATSDPVPARLLSNMVNDLLND